MLTGILLSMLVASPSPAWRVQLATAGGLGGHGTGSIDVDARGGATVTTARGQRCKMTLPRRELLRLERAVLRARLDRWAGVKNGGPEEPDRTRTTVSVWRGGLSGRAAWTEREAERARPDALAVADAAHELIRRAPCAGGTRTPRREDHP